MFKKKLAVVLISTLVLVMTLFPSFANNNQTEFEFKNQFLDNNTLNAKVQEQSSEKESTEAVGNFSDTSTKAEIALLEKAFEIRQKQARKDDETVSNILYKLSQNKDLQRKANDVEKSGRIEAIKYIITYLNSNNELGLNTTELLRLKSYVQSYGPYTDDLTILMYLENSMHSTTASESGLQYAVASTYNTDYAVNYAKSYAKSFNTPTFPNVTSLGGDCANFVSQALKTGGKTTDSTWYISRLNQTYLTPTTVAQLNASWSLADPSPWISAKEFNNYWSSKATSTYEQTGSYIYQNQSTVFSQPYKRGDAVQILKSVLWWYEGYHTMIITGYTSNDYLLSYHTSATLDKSLREIIEGNNNKYNTNTWKFKFFGM